MMTKISIYLSRLLIWSLFIGFCSPSLFAQALVIESRIDSNCILHIRLVDSVGSVASTNAPYLLEVNHIQRNSNALASWEINLSDRTQDSLDIRIQDRNANQYTSLLNSTCYSAPPLSPVTLSNSSTTPTSNCTACTGSISALLNNPSNNSYTFRWSDGRTYSDTIFRNKTNVCPGIYNLIISDTSGNYNTFSFEVNCPTPAQVTCFPMITRYLDANGRNSIRASDVRSSTNITSGQDYFIDGEEQFSSNYTFDCSDVGYQYLTLLTIDTIPFRFDTCRVLVEIVDTFNYCGASTNLFQISDNSRKPTNCTTCNGFYRFDYLVLPITNDTLFPSQLDFFWTDTSQVSTRNNLCPNLPYLLTVIDSNNKRYEQTISLNCNNNTCVDSSLLLPYNYCTNVPIPVCGCNGITYRNACVAKYEAGVQSWSFGPCSSTSLTIDVSTSMDTLVCDSSPLGSGSASVQVMGGIPPFFFTWSMGATTPSISGLHAGNYSVTVTDIINNMAVHTVTIGTQGCVWPGDTDDNAVVNNFDLLTIGLRYAQNGSRRATTSIAWQGFTAMDWLPSPQVLNLDNDKYIDCNGNGLIDSFDILAIRDNYSRNYARSTSNSLLGTIPFYVESKKGQTDDSLHTNIILGDNIDPAINVYAVAFTLNYDPRYFKKDPVHVDFSNSWLGNRLIQVQQDVRRRGQIEVAVSRIDQLPITGAGPIGEVSFTIKDDIMMGRVSGDSIVSPISINNIRLINERNQVIGTYPRTGNIVLKENLSTTRLSTNAGIQIFPNPTQSTLFLRSKQTNLQQVQVFTATGQLVKSIELNQVHNTSLSTQDWPIGLYLLRLQTSAGYYSEKIRISR